MSMPAACALRVCNRAQAAAGVVQALDEVGNAGGLEAVQETHQGVGGGSGMVAQGTHQRGDDGSAAAAGLG